MDKPLKAVLFDAYGTLFDVYSMGLLAEQLFPGQGQAISVLWKRERKREKETKKHYHQQLRRRTVL